MLRVGQKLAKPKTMDILRDNLVDFVLLPGPLISIVLIKKSFFSCANNVALEVLNLISVKPLLCMGHSSDVFCN